MRVSWIITIICTVLAALTLAGGFFGATSAPQEAAAGALAAALAIIPYVFTRALEGLRSPRKD